MLDGNSLIGAQSLSFDLFKALYYIESQIECATWYRIRVPCSYLEVEYWLLLQAFKPRYYWLPTYVNIYARNPFIFDIVLLILNLYIYRYSL